MKVTLLAGYPEDRRISMEVYRLGLGGAIRSMENSGVEIIDHVPRNNGVPDGRWAMRVARYLNYPRHLPQNDGDIFHILDPGYGHLLHRIKRKRTIVTVHDLIPLLRWKGRIKGVRSDHIPFLNLYSYQSLHRATALIAVSENTKKDLVSLLNINPDRITVIPYGLNQVFMSDQNSESVLVLPYRQANGKKRILISGSQFYKNNEISLKVFIKLKSILQDQVELIKIGNPTRPWSELIKQYHLERDIVELGPLEQNRLSSLYREVDLLLFPSLYEGFGLPPLEAMACGTPVVVSTAASLPEVTGGFAPAFDPFDADGFADEILHIFSDVQYRTKVIDEGRQFVHKFSWAEAAKKTIAVYQYVMSL